MTTTIGWISAAVQARMALATRPGTHRRRGRGDLGEGVISAAIAVLIMAFLGAAMWIGFQKMWKSTESTTNQKVEQIGSE
jgi:ABC-type Fe3+ transport system permease subunit